MLPALVSPFGGAAAAAFQLARCLAPHLRLALTPALGPRRTFSSLPSLAELPLAPSDYPRFNPDACAAFSPHGAALETHDRSQAFFSVLSLYRSPYPETVWSKLCSLYPKRHTQQALAIDIAVGCEGRAGVELAKRGFRVLSVNGDSLVMNRTYVYANAHNARINLITAQMEQQLVHGEAADLVTCMHGLHLLDTEQALREAHRILKPRGKLVVAWNDRDLRNSFIGELEDLIERHVPGYRRAVRQHELADWGSRLQQDALFRLVEYNVHSNVLVLRNVATLSDILNSQGYVRDGLHGTARKAFNAAVRDLVEERFGQGPLLLPMATKLFVLEKTTPCTNQ